ncbi:MAG: hypothetical protein WEB04_01915 [Dehalococcoidia bacterium]
MAAPSANSVCEELLIIHREFQETLGEAHNSLSDGCRPLNDLPGFDSTLIPLVIRTLARRLGITLPPKAKITNLYISNDGRQRLTVREIADGFCRKYGGYFSG